MSLCDNSLPYLTKNKEYDDRGRIISSALNSDIASASALSYRYQYDNYGNRLTKGNSVYTWTRGRLLASVGDTTFEYDYKGRRTKKGTTEYYYDGDRLIAEVRSNNTLYYFYDAKGVCGFRYNGKDYEYIKNLFGDIVGIAQGVTLVARYEYDIWGNCTVAYDSEGIGTINPFRYRGYYFDTESGLYYLMSRYYDPEIGQFISLDTADYLAPDTIGGVDLYAYCGYNPVMYVDPTGHAAISIGLVLVAAAIGFGVGFGTSVLTQQAFNNGEWDWKIATVDGLFSAASAALTMIPGIGPGLMGVLNFGLTMANMYLTTGMENDWNYTETDHIVIWGASVFSGFLGYVTRRNFWAEGGKDILTQSHKLSKTLFGRIFSDYYYKHGFGDVSVKSAKGHLMKTLIALNFGDGFWIEWILVWAQSMLSSFYTRLLEELT